MDNTNIVDIATKAKALTKELLTVAQVKPGSILVVGCSSSEVGGDCIGHGSNKEIADILFEAINSVAKEFGIFLAAQCCEHLNRALVIEESCAEKNNYTIVNAIPQVKAGGGFATAAYYSFEKPVLVEKISADVGIDIGQTLIGMHLKAVAVPVRVSVKNIGYAQVTCARTRPKFIGGSRAIYNNC